MNCVTLFCSRKKALNFIFLQEKGCCVDKAKNDPGEGEDLWKVQLDGPDEIEWYDNYKVFFFVFLFKCSFGRGYVMVGKPFSVRSQAELMVIRDEKHSQYCIEVLKKRLLSSIICYYGRNIAFQLDNAAIYNTNITKE